MSARLRPALGLLVALLLLATSTAAASPTPVATPAASSRIGSIYLALGDSIAAGIGASAPTQNGFPVILDGYLSKQAGRPVDLENLAVPGETSSSFLARGQLARALSLISTARTSHHSIAPVTLTLGANDLLDAAQTSQARQHALATLESNLNTILGRLQAALTAQPGFAAADLYVTNYYDPTGTDPTLPDSDAWWLARLNQTIATAAAQAGATLVDIATLFRGHTAAWTWYPSDIHPNNAGHLAFANAIWRSTRDDTTPPAVTIERPTGGTLSRPIPTVIVNTTDRVGVTEVELMVNGKPVGEIPYVPADSAYAVLWDTGPLSPGRYTLEVTASDAAGNAGHASVSVIVPPATTIAPASVATPATSS